MRSVICSPDAADSFPLSAVCVFVSAFCPPHAVSDAAITTAVVNAISLETVAQITELAAGQMQTEIIQVQVSRAKTVGTYHLMQAENPVYICVLTMA